MPFRRHRRPRSNCCPYLESEPGLPMLASIFAFAMSRQQMRIVTMIHPATIIRTEAGSPDINPEMDIAPPGKVIERSFKPRASRPSNRRTGHDDGQRTLVPCRDFTRRADCTTSGAGLRPVPP